MYLAPYDSWANRIAVLRFVQTIPLTPADPGYDIVAADEERLPVVGDRPMLICWGCSDFVFDQHFLAEWERAGCRRRRSTARCGTATVLEDAGAEVEDPVEEFLANR